MAEPTLTEVLGPNSTQTATTITIEKADLVSVGLTASASNTAESILAAIILKAQQTLTAAGFESNPDQSLTVESGFDTVIPRTDSTGNTSNYRQHQLTLNFYKPDSESITPDSY